MSRIKRWLPPLLLCVLGMLSLWIDIPVARFARDGRVPGTIREVLENLEAFGHGAGVVAIALVVYCLESRRRLRATAGLLLAAFGSGLAANLIKLAVRRDRPWQLADGVTHGLETFSGLVTSLGGSHGSQSFPSAHAATAMGLATALACYYPRGRVVFAALAVATAASRIVAPSHFVSDTCVGLALGMVIGGVAIRSPRFAAHISGERLNSTRPILHRDGIDDGSQRAAA